MRRRQYISALTWALVASACAADADVLDYSRAHYFDGASVRNQLFIAIESRSIVRGEHYWLLAPHPRETTFRNDGSIFRHVIEDAKGASDVTFVHTRSGAGGAVLRRFDTPASGVPLLQPIKRYTTLPSQPASIPVGQLLELADTRAILAAARAGKPIIGVVEYQVDGDAVRTDFPVKVLNINPDPFARDMPGHQWQVMSARIVVWPGPQLTSGHVAFSAVGTTTLHFVTLCEQGGRQGDRCAFNRPGSARLYARR
jgi:hypothetical protein